MPKKKHGRGRQPQRRRPTAPPTRAADGPEDQQLIQTLRSALRSGERDELRMSHTVLDLERSGQLRLVDLVTHTFAAEDAPAAFEMLDLAAEPALQVVLDYQARA